MDIVSTLKELASALLKGESSILIEGDLAKNIVRVKATGPIAWASLVGLIGVGVIVALKPRNAPVAAAAAGVVANALGPSLSGAGIGAAKVAISLAAAGGGVGVLQRLRADYDMLVKDDGTVLLTKV